MNRASVCGSAVFFVSLVGLVGSSLAADLHVPSVYPTIQAAIDAAVTDDVVIVAEGTYNENINFGGKQITVRSSDPDAPAVVANTVIDGGAGGPVVAFSGAEPPQTLLSGFTITNGYSTSLGGGIYGGPPSARTSATITNCIITGNSATFGAGVLYFNGAIRNCAIAGNSAEERAGGLGWCEASITNCLIANNSAVRFGGGMYSFDGPITNCTITGNTAGERYGALSPGDPRITNCVIWGNTAPDCAQPCSIPTPIYSCIQDWTGGGAGNISDDPMFADPDGPDDDPATWQDNDYRLQSGSPCIDTGEYRYCPVPLTSDLDGNCRLVVPQIDMGCYEHGATTDSDGDWLADSDESTYGAAPDDRDTDDDDLLDGIEVLRGTNPAIPDPPGDLQVPGEVPSIQEALFLADVGEEIIVAPGSYYENINFLGKHVILRSTDPADPAVVATTIIDGSASADRPVVTFYGSEPPETLLSGFTIANASLAYGDGIYGGQTSATVADCTITNNSGDGVAYSNGLVTNCDITGNSYSGLINCLGPITNCTVSDNSYSGIHNCDGPVTDCVVTDNYSPGYGGGLYASDGPITRCFIANNTSESKGGGVSQCDGVITNCVIVGNTGDRGGGIWDCDGGLVHCTIAYNTTLLAGEGAVQESTGPITNCIIWGNQADLQLWVTSIPTYSCIQDWSGGGEGNIAADPVFADPDGPDDDPNTWEDNDYHIQIGSPCVGWATDAGVTDDLDGNPRPMGSGYDMGAYEANPDGFDPYIWAGPDPMLFLFRQGEPSPDPQQLSIRNMGGGTLNWSVSDDADWLYLDPPAGSCTTETDIVTVTADPSGLADGSYSAVITVSDSNASNSPVTIEVILGSSNGVLLIKPGQTETHPAIQQAIDAADTGDVVVVYPGTYTENINFGGKEITVRSTDPDDPGVVGTTVIQGGAPGSVVNFAGTEGPSTVLSGLTITNSAHWGTGIVGNGCQATISNCVVKDTHYYGIADCDGQIVNCAVIGNYFAGFVYCQGTIADCLIADNHRSGVKYCNGTLINCRIIGNGWKGGIEECNAEIIHCTIADNAGGGIYCCNDDVDLTNCIIWGNGNYQIKLDAVYGHPTYYGSYAWVDYCNVQGGQAGIQVIENSYVYWGVGNINSNPDFYLPDDYHLQASSPCIDAGTDAGVTTDADGNSRPLAGGFDMGAYEYNSSDPSIAAGPLHMLFEADAELSPPPSQQLSIANCGSGTLNWSVSSDAAWLGLDPPAGASTTETDVVQVSLDHAGLAPGYYQAAIVVSAPGAANTPQVVPVQMLLVGPVTVNAQGTGDYPTIQDAVDGIPGGTIILEPGTYHENIIMYQDPRKRALCIRSTDPEDPTVVANTIIDGGGVDRVIAIWNNQAVDIFVSGLTITNGYADVGGGTGGGGISGGKGAVSNCIITGNMAENGAGGIGYFNGPITNCTIVDNHTNGEGGGVGGGASNDVVTLTNCVISGNTAVGTGGGVNGGASTVSMTNCIVTDNYSETHCGGVSGCDGPITNCTIAGNSTSTPDWTSSGLYYCYGPITNCIVWGNLCPWGPQLSACAIPDYSCIQGGAGGGVGNTGANPQFVDPDGPDDDPNTWQDNDYHIQATSPCMDAGDPAGDYTGQTDIDGHPRVLDGRVDMGCDEVLVVSGDFEPDGDVDLDDYAVLEAAMNGPNQAPGDAAADLDGDNDCDLNDLAIFAANFTGAL